MAVAILEKLQHVIGSEADPRMNDLFMMSSPISPILVTTVYILFVTKIGPMLMQSRKPLELKKVLIAYNLFQVLASGYLFYKGSTLGWMSYFTWFCQKADFSEAANQYAIMAWLYHLMKYVEFLDTIFFVLRKKFNQITVLHVFHHAYMALTTWSLLKFRPVGAMTFCGYINTFVHLIMYAYYLLATFGPRMQKYLWWKKYLTMLQLAQFTIILIHTIPHYFIADCDVPFFFLNTVTFGAGSFVILFLNFYRMEYIKKKRQTTEEDTAVKSKNR